MNDDDTYAEVAFNAYGATAGWKRLPTWEELANRPGGAETRRRWRVAIDAVMRKLADENPR